jgi:hypothetical protein
MSAVGGDILAEGRRDGSPGAAGGQGHRFSPVGRLSIAAGQSKDALAGVRVLKELVQLSQDGETPDRQQQEANSHP